MEHGIERRSALALLAVPVGVALAASARAEVKPASSPQVTFDVWMQVNTLGQTYSDCVDRLDFDGLEQIFTADATYDYAPGSVKVGRSAISEFLKKALVTQAHTIHFVGVPAVTVGRESGTYTSWMSVMARHEGKNGENHTVYARYVDLLTPDPSSGALLIARRKVITQIAEGVGAGNPRYWLERGA